MICTWKYRECFIIAQKQRHRQGMNYQLETIDIKTIHVSVTSLECSAVVLDILLILLYAFHGLLP